MGKTMLILTIGAFIIAMPSFLRIFCGDYRELFWSDVFFDVLIIGVACWSRNLIVVVCTQVVVNMINGWIYQKRADDIYAGLDKKPNIQKKQPKRFSFLQLARN